MTAIDSPDSTLQAIRGFVVEHYLDGAGAALQPATPLVTSGILDSHGVLDLIGFLEERFSIRIADDEVGIDTFNTLEALSSLVCRKAGEGGAEAAAQQG